MNMRHHLPLMVVPQKHRLQVKPKLVQDHLLTSPQSVGSSSETSSTSGEDSSSEDDGGQEKHSVVQMEPSSGTENQTQAPIKEDGTSELTMASTEMPHKMKAPRCTTLGAS